MKTQFQVPLAEGAKIVDQAKAKCNGFSKRVRYAMSHETGKIEILGMLNDKEMLFKYHQAKDPKNSSRIFTVELEDWASLALKEIYAVGIALIRLPTAFLYK